MFENQIFESCQKADLLFTPYISDKEILSYKLKKNNNSSLCRYLTEAKENFKNTQKNPHCRTEDFHCMLLSLLANNDVRLNPLTKPYKDYWLKS